MSFIKNTKKPLRILKLLGLFLLLLLIGAYLAIQSSPVQTWLAQRLADHFSERTGHTIRIEKVNIEWFRTLSLEGVYIEDQEKDTLLRADALKGRVGNFSFSDPSLHFDRVQLDRPHIEFHRYPSDTAFNFQRFLDHFRSDEPNPNALELSGEELLIRNGRFSLREHDSSAARAGKVNFQDLRLEGLGLHIAGMERHEDSVSAGLQDLRFREIRSGFTLDSLAGRASFGQQGLALNAFSIITPHSSLSGDLRFEYDDPRAFQDFVQKVTIEGKLGNSRLDSRDLAYFVEDLQGMDRQVGIEGKVRGKVSDLKVQDLLLELTPRTYFKGNVELIGLPEIDNSFISIDADDLNARKGDLEQIPIPPFSQGRTLSLPPQLARLGNMNFKGRFVGFPNDFVTKGTLGTDIGTLRADLEFARDDRSGHFKYDGELRAMAFDVGSYYRIPDMGRLTASLDLTGSGYGIERVRTDIVGNIQRFEYLNYPYKDLQVSGELENERFRGELSGSDPNFDFAFNGSLDFSDSIPSYSFSMDVQKVHPVALNWMERDSSVFLKTRLQFDGQGMNMDELSGTLGAYETVYKEGGSRYDLGDIELNAADHPEGKALRFSSLPLTASVTGHFDPVELPGHFVDQVHKVVPSLFQKEIEKGKGEQRFDFQVQVMEERPITELLLQDWKVPANTVMNGSFDSRTDEFQLTGFAPSLAYKEERISKVNLQLLRRKDVLELDLRADSLFLGDSLRFDKTRLVAKALNDNVQLQVGWDNGDPRTAGSLEALMTFRGMEHFEFEVLSSEFTVQEENWKIDPGGKVSLDSSALGFQEFRFGDGERHFDLEGKVSRDPDEELKLSFDDFELNIIAPFLPPKLDPKGTVNGKAIASDLYGDPLFKSDIQIVDAWLAGHLLGDLSMLSEWSAEEQALMVQGGLRKKGKEELALKGKYFPEREEELAIDIEARELDIAVLNGLIEGGISRIRGGVSGTLKLGGSLKDPLLTGEAQASDVSLHVDALNVTYGFDQEELVFYEDMIGFDHIPVHYVDPKSGERITNRGRATGTLIHEHFQEWNFNIFLELERMLAMNLDRKMNDLYYGTAYGSGEVEISGYPGTLSIDVDAQTEKGTDLKLPLAGDQDVRMENFVTFVDKDQEEVKMKTPDLEGIDMNFDLEVTPDARISIIFDEKIGDVMKGRGRGNIKMEVNTAGKFNMYGQFEVQEGDYLFTMQNVINKRFLVQEGGTIEWFGSPYEATINLDAVYKLRTSIYTLMQGTSDQEAYRRRIPVELVMHLSRDLMNPEIAFDIRFPTLDENDRSMAMSRIESVNKQAFALLVLKRFVDEQGQGGGDGSQRAGVGTNTSSELLSNQLSNWLSSISEDFDLGVNYRPGDGVTDEELAVALSTQLFNERVSLSGNFGVSSSSEVDQGQEEARSQNRLVGDFTIQYDITEDGKFRLKVFNESNQDRIDQIQGSDYTQGVGLYYQEEFDSAAELLDRIGNLFRREKGRREEEEKEEEKEQNEEEPELEGGAY